MKKKTLRRAGAQILGVEELEELVKKVGWNSEEGEEVEFVLEKAETFKIIEFFKKELLNHSHGDTFL